VQKLNINSHKYPPILKNYSGMPEVLYATGDLSIFDMPALAIVGTRAPSEYGKKITKGYAHFLSKSGVVVVSGLARGVDTIAHHEALAAGGKTIAVLGSGLDVVYPSENKNLFEEIVKSGIVITEHPPGTKPLPNHFLARNRIISGLSQGVLVVEGRQRSGTLSTAAHAADQGKEVFAVPGAVDNPNSFAPNYLIDQGARIVRHPKDILDTFL